MSDPSSDLPSGVQQGLRPPPSTRLGGTIAVVGLILALVPCCPPAGLVGCFMGLLGYTRLRRAAAAGGGPSLSLRRVAVAAIVIGAASSIGWSLAITSFAKNQEAAQQTAMEAVVADVVRDAVAGETGSRRTEWAGSAVRPDTVVLLDFGRELGERYGGFESFAIVSTVRGGSMFAPRFEAAGIFRFEHASPIGSARFEIRTVPGRFTPAFTLRQIVIEDAEHGDLTIGRPLDDDGD